ncbi:hypothetical protein L9F63_009703, partial [Diploptera punctata]
ILVFLQYDLIFYSVWIVNLMLRSSFLSVHMIWGIEKKNVYSLSSSRSSSSGVVILSGYHYFNPVCLIVYLHFHFVNLNVYAILNYMGFYVHKNIMSFVILALFWFLMGFELNTFSNLHFTRLIIPVHGLSFSDEDTITVVHVLFHFGAVPGFVLHLGIYIHEKWYVFSFFEREFFLIFIGGRFLATTWTNCRASIYTIRLPKIDLCVSGYNHATNFCVCLYSLYKLNLIWFPSPLLCLVLPVFRLLVDLSLWFYLKILPLSISGGSSVIRCSLFNFLLISYFYLVYQFFCQLFLIIYTFKSFVYRVFKY